MRTFALKPLLCSAAFAVSAHQTAAAQDAAPTSPASPAISALGAALEAGRPEALAGFWRDVQRTGAPLVEAHPHRDSSRVTFVYRGDAAARTVRLSSGLNALLIAGGEQEFVTTGGMRRLPDTDLWYLSLAVSNDLRASYRFEVTTSDTTTERLDPLNPRVYRPDRAALRASLLELPDAPPQPWHSRKEMGSWRQRKVADRNGEENEVFVYLPAGFDSQRRQPYPVLIGLDSYSFGIGMPGALLLDHLVATRAIAPTVMLATNLPRGDGLKQMEVTADYIADRLLPQLRAELNLSSDPRDVIIAGSSRRGLVAAYVGFEKPGTIGNVLSLSGSFYWKPASEPEYEWLTHRFAVAEVRPLRVFLSAGKLENVVTRTNRGHYMLATNRHLRDVLAARGYDVEYWEFAGAHSDLNWQDALARGLVALAGLRETAP